MSSIYPPSPDLKPYTYRIDCLSNGMWYWGVRKPRTWPDDDYMGSSRYVHEDIEKYGIENFEKTVLEFFDTYEEARSAEYKLIARDLNDSRCYNRSNGKMFSTGEKHPMWGRTHTEETKFKISKANKGNTHSKDSRYKMSLANKGKRHTEESKQKIRKASYGRKHTKEAKRKIGKAQRGKIISEKTKLKMSKASRNISLVSCIYCQKVNSVMTHARWHGDRCSKFY